MAGRGGLIVKITINYENLREWMQLKRITYQSMARTATEWGAPVSAASLGKYVRTGSAIPSTVIVALSKAYKWTVDEVACLFMNGPLPDRTKKGPSQAEIALTMIAAALKPYLEGDKNGNSS